MFLLDNTGDENMTVIECDQIEEGKIIKIKNIVIVGIKKIEKLIKK